MFKGYTGVEIMHNDHQIYGYLHFYWKTYLNLSILEKSFENRNGQAYGFD